MPALDSVIEDETVESLVGTRILPTVRAVTFDCFCEGFHLQSGGKIAKTIVISERFGKETEHNQIHGDYES
jgi:hypothetical protein